MPTAKITAALDTSAPIPPKRPPRSVARKLRRVLRVVGRSPGVPRRANDARAVDAPAWRAGLVTAVGRAPWVTPETWAIVAKGSAWPIPAATLATPEALVHIGALLTAHCARNVPRTVKRRARALLDELARDAARETRQNKENKP